ncbi:MAG: DUF262 domain-containing protein [Brevinema sp.]
MGNNEKYVIQQLSVGPILTHIQDHEIVVPEIQRPFAWNASQVRDLIDSLYNGYPTGYLIIWRNPNVRLKDGKNAEGKRILIDGQQRVAALMTAVVGFSILTEDYKRKTIKIAFNPTAAEDEECFAVQTPAHTKDKRWIADISILFKQDFSSRSFINNYLSANTELDERQIEQSIEKLLALKTCQLGVIMLDSSLNISEVTEIFVRINSRGKRLDQADFAMSKIAADEKYGGNLLRKAIDYFCHLAVNSSFYHNIAQNDVEFMNSEYEPKMKWLKDNNENIYDPNYNDMLRVSFMHQIQRGKLADLVSMLSGRDFTERSFKEEIAEKSFLDLKKGVLNFINQHHFENFVSIIKSAGFISPKLLHSKMTLDFAYTLYLLLHSDSSIPKQSIKSKVQKWFVLSTISGRYSLLSRITNGSRSTEY